MSDRIWVNDERTILVSLYPSGTAAVATRPTPAHTWGPPVTLTEELTNASAGRSSGEAVSPDRERE